MKNLKQYGILKLLEEGVESLADLESVPGFDIFDLELLVIDGEVRKDGDRYFIGSADDPFVVFKAFIAKWPGKKLSAEKEFENFKKKYKKWRSVLPELLPNLERQVKEREALMIAINAAMNAGNKNHGLFIEPWPHLSTYINQSRWGFQYYEIPHQEASKQSDFYLRYIAWFETSLVRKAAEWPSALLKENELLEWAQGAGEFKERKQYMSPEGTKAKFLQWHQEFLASRFIQMQHKALFPYIIEQFKKMKA
jgi:hypothetical protein